MHPTGMRSCLIVLFTLIIPIHYSVADLHSKILGARPPPPKGSKFFQFHAVFGEIWQNRMLAPPPPSPGSWRPLLGEILDPPLLLARYTIKGHNFNNRMRFTRLIKVITF